MQSTRAVLIVTASLVLLGLAALFFGTARGDAGAGTVAQSNTRAVQDDGSTARASLDLAQPATIDPSVPTIDKNANDSSVVARADNAGARAGVRPIVHVVHETGDPASSVRVSFSRTDGNSAGTSRAPLVAVSDANGMLVFEDGLAFGSWRYELPEHIQVVGSERTLKVAANASRAHTITIRVPDPNRVVSGRVVVDEDDLPVEHALVVALDVDGRELGRATTDEAGAFHVVRSSDEDLPLRLSVTGAPGFDDLLTPGLLDWGTDHVVLPLRASGSLRVVVVEAGTERPVEAFAVSWFAVRSDVATLQGVEGRAAHHPDGRALVERVPSGPVRIVVTPTDHALAPSEPLEFDHTGSAHAAPEVRVEVSRRENMLVRVRFEDGRAAIGTRVELLASVAADGVGLRTLALHPGRHARISDARSHVMLCDSATTDADGEVTLGWRASGRRLDVRLVGPSHLPQIERAALVPGTNGTLDIVVHAGATFMGVVRPLTVLDDLTLGQLGRTPGKQGPTIILTYTGDATGVDSHWRRSCRIDEHGGFEFSGLQPGPWMVQLRDVTYDPSRASNSTTKVFAPIELVGDAVHDVVLDIADLAPSALVGHVLLDGLALSERTVHLLRVESDTDGHYNRAGQTTVVTDANGRFSATGLRPGRYHASIDGSQVSLFAQEAIDVEPGKRATETLRIDTGQLVVRVLDSAGEPMGLRTIEITQPRTSFRTTVKTDAKGLARCAPITTGRYIVHVAPTAGGDPRARLGEVAVSAGLRSDPVDLSLSVSSGD